MGQDSAPHAPRQLRTPPEGNLATGPETRRATARCGVPRTHTEPSRVPAQPVASQAGCPPTQGASPESSFAHPTDSSAIAELRTAPVVHNHRRVLGPPRDPSYLSTRWTEPIPRRTEAPGRNGAARVPRAGQTNGAFRLTETSRRTGNSAGRGPSGNAGPSGKPAGLGHGPTGCPPRCPEAWLGWRLRSRPEAGGRRHGPHVNPTRNLSHPLGWPSDPDGHPARSATQPEGGHPDRVATCPAAT